MSSIEETIGRSALLAFASNYESVADALMELIDNPFDKRRGRRLSIDIGIDNKHRDKRRRHVVITDSGGEGMNNESLQEWLRWGEGEDHREDDIGQYRVGGKLAAIYLAESLEIRCRKADERTIWQFTDSAWGSRTQALTDSELTEVPVSDMTWPGGEEPPRGAGFTQVTLTHLKPNRYEIDLLKERLADTYRSLIEDGGCVIRVNRDKVTPRPIPWSSSIAPVPIAKMEVAKGVSIEGKVGAIDRDQVPNARGVRIPAGIRTEFNGRKISDGEEFGFKLSGKGSLQRVYGEIAIRGRGIKPNQLKTGWLKDSEEWAALEACMKGKMDPIVSQLNHLSEVHPVTKEQRARAKNARNRAEEAFRKLDRDRHFRGEPGTHGDTQEQKEPGGRKPATPSDKVVKPPAPPRRGTRGQTQNPTPAPEDAVGKLLRRVARSGRMPPVDYAPLGTQIEQTQWRENDDGTRTVVINTDFPLYKSLGEQEDYAFASLVQHLVFDDVLQVKEARNLINEVIWLDSSEG